MSNETSNFPNTSNTSRLLALIVWFRMPRQYFYERINWQETSPCARFQITWNRISRAKEYLLHCISMLIWAADWWDWCASWDKDETFSLWHPPTPPLCTHACNNSWQQNINKVSCQQQLQQHRQWQWQWWKIAKILTQECFCALLVRIFMADICISK